MVTKQQARQRFKKFIRRRFGAVSTDTLLTDTDSRTKKWQQWLDEFESDLTTWGNSANSLTERKEQYDTVCHIYMLYFGYEG
jgi:hypothetical protein